MSWIERMLEPRLADAARDGELDGGPLTGKPLPDLDRQRQPGWWAERFVARELSHDRRIVAVAVADAARAGFWRAVTYDDLQERVTAANRAIAAANVELVPADRLALFDLDAVADRWRTARRPRDV